MLRACRHLVAPVPRRAHSDRTSAAPAKPAVPRRLSRMHADVFSLYRSFLRVAQCKGGAQARAYVRDRFRAVVASTTNIKHAEAVYGRGRKQLDMLRRAEGIRFT